ncbi:16S rRNA (uracil(1498)-N(3))-methyltransferase [Corynebacterium sp. zg254]|uniref:Ribosomal RNA small subunit methyltransferase E n=2 Tax=Corynebacteriaceae TaxID=1653 RepID=A0ABQ6VDB1_9CORY|nr:MULTISPECIES: 16S rRNA (uracil(1498)-N(3))-methyltransferase [Corynebacterium]KAB3520905.1 16S rRNA (uracil(1498)-N(3))-methyltransferase [Corynebacterium zhongnanshanii]MCR5914534.1 16S rRNA (uracil(1498)-N(3))-methyltransferase [Corynebacterium sp. zg254]
MTDPVFIHPIPADATVGSRFQLTGAEARHTEVKRMREGESLVVSDGVSRAVAASWSSGEVEIREFLPIPAPRPRVTVVQAIPKSERSELAVDLMVQAGADRVIPWAAARCVSRWDGKEAKAKAKWENAARAAAKQSRRLTVPPVEDLLRNIEDLRHYAQGTSRIVVLHEQASTPIAEQDFDVDEIFLVVGPEGSIAPEELEALDALGAQRVVMGPEVLRTAAAATVALGALGVLTQRWSG